MIRLVRFTHPLLLSSIIISGNPSDNNAVKQRNEIGIRTLLNNSQTNKANIVQKCIT